MEEEVKRLVEKFLEGIDEDSLRRGEVWSLERFKANVGKIGVEMLGEPPEVKEKVLSGVKAAGLQLIANIPIVTPIITAFLEVATSEDLGGKVDKLGNKIDSGFRNLGEKMDNLGEKMDNLGEKMDRMLGLQEKTLTILDERLPKNQKA
jgi:hypothetical protein